MIQQPCILNDVTRCIGCEECVAGCKSVNNLPDGDTAPRVGASADRLNANRWTTILRTESGDAVRKQCRHCAEPACVSVCPVGALKKTAEGPVVYDSDICMGCRYCMMACPYGIPRYEWDSPVPWIRKCTMCYEKIKSGEIDKPGCVAACPEEATTFGTREEMLAEARRRMKASPGRYIDHIWGEKEVGGSNVLYISNLDLSFLAWQSLALPGGDQPLPDRTWHALRKVPAEFLGMGALMTGVWWVIDRRMKRQGAAAEPHSDATDEVGDE